MLMKNNLLSLTKENEEKNIKCKKLEDKLQEYEVKEVLMQDEQKINNKPEEHLNK